MENFPKPEQTTMEEDVDFILTNLNKLNVHELRRLAIGEHLISSDEIVLGEADEFKKKIIDHVYELTKEKAAHAKIKVVRNRIENKKHVLK